jgi:6-pyruvoyltetrahydropterin/6-carboxytetrahydropterin synthase
MMTSSAADSQQLMTLTRHYDFSASHRLYNPSFSDARNWEVFRECNNPNGHGHNYEIEVTVAGPPEPKTGMVVDIVQLDAIVNRTLIKPCDHKHLNLDVAMFDGVIPTAENIAVVFWQRLVGEIPEPARLYRIRVIESKNNAAEYYGETVLLEENP